MQEYLEQKSILPTLKMVYLAKRISRFIINKDEFDKLFNLLNAEEKTRF